MEPKYVSVKQAVQEFISKGHATKPWINAGAEMGAWDKLAEAAWPNIFGAPKQIITEDAEVVSIETVR